MILGIALYVNEEQPAVRAAGALGSAVAEERPHVSVRGLRRERKPQQVVATSANWIPHIRQSHVDCEARYPIRRIMLPGDEGPLFTGRGKRANQGLRMRNEKRLTILDRGGVN